MILSTASKEEFNSFRALMKKTDVLLNEKANNEAGYFKDKSGKKLEVEVYNALEHCAKGTGFSGTIKLISGVSFPDIIAKRYYGVEVKSTEKNHWQSIGSSILESTRNQEVKRIFLTFGKLGEPTEFRSKSYEDCLSEIVVTHYPRYRIDMQLQEKGEKNIFEKIGAAYDDLRRMDNPVPLVSDYYKKMLKPGQSLWWATDDVEEVAAPMSARLWSTLDADEKARMTNYGYAFFPETITLSGASKYQRYALWLATEKGIINTNIRDSFSAGGRFEMKYLDGSRSLLPAVFGRIASSRRMITNIIQATDEKVLCSHWGIIKLSDDRVEDWIQCILRYSQPSDIEDYSKFLHYVF